MKIDRAAIPGMKVTVMGLGINGGGLASALFFARHGARVTVTDLRPAGILSESMEKLRDFPVRYVLEKHVDSDFAGADLVIKNPAVAPTSPFLQKAREAGVAIETDLSVFLTLALNPVLAVTGSKGKSTTASAMAFVLSGDHAGTRLGGNITVSPLAFIDDLAPADPVVLELSSWQLGDLRGKGLLAPRISAFTVILPDHLDRYRGMDDYVADKKAIFQEQRSDQKAVFNRDDPWQKDFPSQTRAQSFLYAARPLPPGIPGAWLEQGRGFARLTPDGEPSLVLADALVPGMHNRMNLLCAALSLGLYGMAAERVREGLSRFPGIEHRLEMVRSWRGIRFYNDSAATIPHATVQALKSLPEAVVLITGGTDKNIDFSPLAEVAATPKAIILLEGTGTEKIRAILDGAGVRYEGPFRSLKDALEAGVARARVLAENGEASLLFSPGCTSFGMFLNEFDRGRTFKEMVAGL